MNLIISGVCAITSRMSDIQQREAETLKPTHRYTSLLPLKTRDNVLSSLILEVQEKSLFTGEALLWSIHKLHYARFTKHSPASSSVSVTSIRKYFRKARDYERPYKDGHAAGKEV